MVVKFGLSYETKTKTEGLREEVPGKRGKSRRSVANGKTWGFMIRKSCLILFG